MSDPASPQEGFAPPSVDSLQAALPQFEIIELIGAGGMGAVYKARQPKLDRLVAIKVLPPVLTAGSDFEERFQIEARAMAKMKHGRIVTVHDFGETEDGLLYIVMEFVEGNDLTHLIRAGSLPPEQALAVVTQICDALNYAHRRHVVHRDIKPANVMLDVEGQVKVADFGLARMIVPGEQRAVGEESGVTMGSPDYVAPEQLEIGKEGDERADIYALGVMMYEMLTGRVPRGDFAAPSKVNPDLDPRLDAVVARAMDPDREARYQQVSQLWHELDQIRTSPQPGETNGPAGPAKKVQLQFGTATGPGKKRSVTIEPASQPPNRSALIYGLIVAVLLIGFLAFLFNRGESDPQVDPIVQSEATPSNSDPSPVETESIVPEKPAPQTEVAAVPEKKPPSPRTESTPPAGNLPPAMPETPAEQKIGRETEASLAVAGIFKRYEQSYQRALAADLNLSYLAALEREIEGFKQSGDTVAAGAFSAERDLLREGGNAPVTGKLPEDCPARLFELRVIYAGSIEKKRQELAEKAAGLIPAVDAELRELEGGFSAAGKEPEAREVAAARKSLGVQGLPFLSANGPKPLKIFILCGQANMQGNAHVRTMDAMRLDPTTKPILDLMRDGDGEPVVLDDVWISSIGGGEERVGKLTAGFAPKQGGPKFGPEFTFGIYAHRQLGEPILLIKTAWGGESLHTDFRPPSAGPYEFSETHLKILARKGEDLAAIKAQKAEDSGRRYRLMLEHVKRVLADPKRVHPDYDAKAGYELSGFVWFQGWNDMVHRETYPARSNPGGYDAYSELLAHFIRDVRKDLGAPELPFVIGVLGVGGPTALYGLEQQDYKSIHQSFRDAMAAPAALPEFKDKVAAVLTENYWDLEVSALKMREQPIKNEETRLRKEDQLSPEEQQAVIEKLYAETFSAEELEMLQNSVAGPEYHYFGSAKIMSQIGKAFAEAAVELAAKDSSSAKIPSGAPESPPSPEIGEGRLRGSGETAKGEPIDISRAADFDDFVDVEYHMDHWAAIRSNGDVISSLRRLDGLEGVAQVTITGPRNYVRYRDGRVECRPEYALFPLNIDNAIDMSIGISDGIALLEDGSVAAWGRTFSQPGSGPPPGLKEVIDIATIWGSSNSPSNGFALTANGAIVTWGDESNPFTVPEDLPPIKDIEAGWTHLLCLTDEGSIISLPGPGRSPQPLPADLPAAVAIRARGPFYAAQEENGTWHAWGPGQFGVVSRINEIGRAHRITFKGNRWHGVFWIEPKEGD